MADKTSRSAMAEGARSGRGSSARNSQVKTKPTDIRQKEEEYKRLNEELEAKTADLVREAEKVMRDQETALSKSRTTDTINTDDFLKMKTRESAKFKAGDDSAFLTQFDDMSLSERIHQLEGTVGEDGEEEDDILPEAAADMGSEATIRFLKAKLRVMQEEVDRLAEEIHRKDEECRKSSKRLKEVEEERGRHMRTVAAQQTQIDKYKKLAEDTCAKSDSTENQLLTLKKEVEQLKRNQKQSATAHSATEVRLNRALEEVTRYKEQLHKTKTSSKDSSDSEKKRVEQLMADNSRLEKQKNELMTGFKKQLKLIDILKRQKMHIEAAKMLQFSEEEFVKALEWGN